MNKYFKHRIIIILTLIVLPLCSCNNKNNNHGAKKNITLIFKMSSGSYWSTVKLGAEKAATEMNANLNFSSPIYEDDIYTQIKLMNEAIDCNDDAIILSSSDYNSLVSVTEKAFDKKIPVIIIDSEVNTKKIACRISTDNFAAAKGAANALIKTMGTSGTVGIVSFVKGSRNAQERENGVISILSKYKNIKVLPTEYCLSNSNQAYQLAKTMIASNKDLTGIIALSLPSSEGVAKAVDESKLKSKIKVIAFDSSLKEIEYIEKGIIQTTIIQNPFNIGYLSVKNAVETTTKGTKLPPYIDTGFQSIDIYNMYNIENQKLLFPFVN